MKTKRKPYELPFKAAAVLLVLTLFSICMSSRLLGRYTSSDQSNDSSRIASFSISPGQSYAIKEIVFENMAPGETQSYSFSLSSQSEVAVECKMRISTTGNLPLEYTVNNVSIPEGNAYASVNILQPNSSEQTYTLTASWPSTANQTQYLYEIDAVKLIITAEQID